MTDIKQFEKEKKTFISKNQEKFYKIFINVCNMREAEINKQEKAVDKTIKEINKKIKNLESKTKNMKLTSNEYKELKSLKKLKKGNRLVSESKLDDNNIVRKKNIENSTFQDLRKKKNQHKKSKIKMFNELEEIKEKYNNILLKYDKILELNNNKKLLHWYMLGDEIFTKFKEEFERCQKYLKYTHSSRSNFEELYEYLFASTERTQMEMNENKAKRTVENGIGIVQLKPLKGGKFTKKRIKSSKKVKRKIHTGPKGGKYYIKNGKKVYI